MINKVPQNHQANTLPNNQWFAEWFNTPYYHILYKDRNHGEAKLFMDNLTAYLNLTPGARILDLACGKGRHALYLNELGYKVTGADLSVNSIAQASASATSDLQFIVHDMRQPLAGDFDVVFNLFTSFGYFDNDQDHLSTLLAISNSLNEYGLGVIDFMNVPHVLRNLVQEETKCIDGIDFHIKRKTTASHIIKEISFIHQGVSHHYVEQVRAFTLDDFEKMMEEAGIYLLDVFGDYQLNKYTPKAERLILIFK